MSKVADYAWKKVDRGRRSVGVACAWTVARKSREWDLVQAMSIDLPQLYVKHYDYIRMKRSRRARATA